MNVLGVVLLAALAVGSSPCIAGALSGKRILIVDDNSLQRSFLHHVLNRAGAIVVGNVGDSVSALRLVDNKVYFDMAIVDYQLGPRAKADYQFANGGELATMLRGKGIKAPIILRTDIPAEALPEDHRRDVNLIIRRSFLPSQLVESLASWNQSPVAVPKAAMPKDGYLEHMPCDDTIWPPRLKP